MKIKSLKNQNHEIIIVFKGNPIQHVTKINRFNQIGWQKYPLNSLLGTAGLRFGGVQSLTL